MWEKIVAFFMSIIAFLASLFGIGGDKNAKSYHFMNESYGSNERQTMNLYVPKKTDDGTCGLILYIHGGAWIAGNKEDYFDKKTFNYISDDLGMAAATISYRYISETTDLNDIMDDIDLALKAIKTKGEEKGININRVMLTGTSAGAHLSMLYAYSRKDSAPITPSCVVSYCGPTNLADENFYYNNDMGNTDFMCQLMSCACGYQFTEVGDENALPYLEKVSPLTYVDANTVPTAFAHGLKDTTVPYSNATALEAALKANGVTYDFVTYPNSSHSLTDDPDCTKMMNDLMYNYAMAYVK